MKRQKKNIVTLNPSGLIGLMTILMTSLSVGAQTATRSPLVVGIMVEGLSDEYLSALQPNFVEGGFNRLLNKAVHISDLQYGPAVDATAATAMVYTGAAPMVNGIPSAYIYSSATNQTSPVLLDAKAMGNFTDETLSPRAIKVSTLADEVRVDTDGEGMVYSVAADPQMAIITAGHSANGAYWIYDHTGNWATSTFYSDMPSTLSNRNYRTPLRTRLDTMTWTPSLPMVSYPMLSRSEQSKPFRINFPSKKFDRYIRFKETPLANREVTDVAIDLISASKLGRDNDADLLTITYNLTPSGLTKVQQIDFYLRLDRDLARLFDAIDKASGTNRPTIFLAGLPSAGSYTPDNKKWNIPTGEYSVKRALSLLEMYLIATHGNGDWVTGYHNRHFYLNRKLIADHGLNINQLRTETADFLARMAGVSNVMTIDDIIAGRAGDDPAALKRNTSVEHSGDVIIEVNPGWVIVDDSSNPKPKANPSAERMNATHIPAFILTPTSRPQRIDNPVDARALAPAIAGAIRIRAPNAASIGSLRIN
ncbi:MAG: alkaline phosphatase family protein [Bacteroides sp.]|nr:alkaline phosphatase family protein [Bacteroides sp.]MCM1413894.1 alkaline phosphatase family protein [Bacteroides sp.]